jgi:hypothetical protein
LAKFMPLLPNRYITWRLSFLSIRFAQCRSQAVALHCYVIILFTMETA